VKNRILVLGAGGFIGRRVIDDLARDPSVTPVAATRGAHAAEFPRGVEMVTLDATNAVDLARTLENAAGVVNCVAGSMRSIVDGARALAAAARSRERSLRIVHLSSLAVYGTATGIVDESSTLLGDLDEYSGAKVTAESALGGLASLVTLRPGIVYGPGSPLWSVYIGRLLAAGRLGNLGTDGEGICNLVFIDDVVRAIKRALTYPGIEGGVFNLSGALAPTWNDYFRLYALALGATPVRAVSKLRLAAEMRLISPALKIVEILANSKAQRLPPAIRPWLLARCRHRIRMDVRRAEDTLKMAWQPLEIGLAATAKWFRDGGRS